MNGSNRTIVGLKLNWQRFMGSPSLCSNRTIVGLKHELGKRTISTCGGSNRTIVGLKQNFFSLFDIPRKRSNRTIVGLKLPLSFLPLLSCARSNRTIVGLKLLIPASDFHLNGLQQSHHCGIETDGVAFASTRGGGQQSHHCGIETTSLSATIFVIIMAAIAPLWD